MDRRLFLCSALTAPTEPYIRRVYSFLWNNPLAAPGYTIGPSVGVSHFVTSVSASESIVIEGYDQFGNWHSRVVLPGTEPTPIPALKSFRVYSLGEPGETVTASVRGTLGA